MENTQLVKAPETIQEAIALNNSQIEDAEWFEMFLDAHSDSDCCE